ncbi:hypothetical protein SLA2020_328460 [Shorea laevis]
MASDELIESHKENAEIYHGEDVCKQKSLEVLEEYSLPKGLVPTEIVEFGHNRSSSFVWMKNKAKKEHRFKLLPCLQTKIEYEILQGSRGHFFKCCH